MGEITALSVSFNISSWDETSEKLRGKTSEEEEIKNKSKVKKEESNQEQVG